MYYFIYQDYVNIVDLVVACISNCSFLFIQLIQFMLIFKYAHEGTLQIEGLKTIAACCDVAEEGVGGAKSFFEAKITEVSAS